MTGVSYQNDRCFQTAILMSGWNLQKINKYVNDKHYIDQKFYNIEWIFKAAEVCTCIYFIKYKGSIKWSKDCSINNQNQNNPIPHSLK